MKKWLCVLLALLVLCAGGAVQAKEQEIEYIGGVVLRTFPKGNEAPGDEYINVGYVECSMPYLLLDHVTSWTLGIEGGQAPYDIIMKLYRRPIEQTIGSYQYYDTLFLGDQRSFNYVFTEPGDYLWQITVTDQTGQTLVFQPRPIKTAEEKEEGNAQTVAGKVNEIIAQEITAGMSEYQRALVLHDWLIYNANYDFTYTWYDPAGVLLYGTGVCDSYARAYQMLCTAAGLECIYVSGLSNGGAHGWNLVKVDGNWYHVDCTWDDPGDGGYECHDYFLLTDEEMGRDHDWNIADRNDMFVPDAEDGSFVGGAVIDADFTFSTMEECAESFRQMTLFGEHRALVVAQYTGDEDIQAFYDVFRAWARAELNDILGAEGGRWSGWRAKGNNFYVSISWQHTTEYVRFNEEKVILSVGEEKKIAAADYYPAADAFTWVSSDPSVAAVSSAYSEAEGLTMTLTGVSGGSAVITVTSKDGASDSVEVVVMPALAPDIHVEEEATADGIHLTWPVVPGVTEYHVHIMIEGQAQAECVMILEDHEAYLTNAQLPANEEHEVWIVGRRVVDGEVVAEYCGEHKHHNGHNVSTSHTPVTDAAVAPTCTASGLTEGSHCAVCGGVITAQEVIPALGHDELMDLGAEPTCTQTGLSDGSHCSRCGVVITAQEVIPALGHDELMDWGAEPTCTQTGLSDGSHCSRCGVVIIEQEVIPALGHEAFTVEGVPATHVTTGLTDLVACTRCGEVLQQQESIPVVRVEQFTVPGVVQRIDAEAFAGCRFACVVIGEGCRSIGASAFADNPALRFVEIPASVTSIDASAFDGCSEELIIVAKSGSAAEAFARQNGMLLVIH